MHELEKLKKEVADERIARVKTWVWCKVEIDGIQKRLNLMKWALVLYWVSLILLSISVIIAFSGE